ncbi:hypothetical protein ACE6H2_010654 [Prunus campanulata]
MSKKPDAKPMHGYYGYQEVMPLSKRSSSSQFNEFAELPIKDRYTSISLDICPLSRIIQLHLLSESIWDQMSSTQVALRTTNFPLSLGLTSDIANVILLEEYQKGSPLPKCDHYPSHHDYFPDLS